MHVPQSGIFPPEDSVSHQEYKDLACRVILAKGMSEPEAVTGPLTSAWRLVVDYNDFYLQALCGPGSPV